MMNRILSLIIGITLPMTVLASGLIPVPCADPALGNGGFMFGTEWISRKAVVENSGDVVFLAPDAERSEYTSAYKYADSCVSLLQRGWWQLMADSEPLGQSGWELIKLGNADYAMLVYYSPTGKPAVIGFPGTGTNLTPLNGERLSAEYAMRYSRFVVSGDGTVGLADVSDYGLFMLTPSGAKWLQEAVGEESYSYRREMACDITGDIWFCFEEAEDGTAWLCASEGADGISSCHRLVEVADSLNHDLSVACSEDGKAIYYTNYNYTMNGSRIAQIMKATFVRDSWSVSDVKVVSRSVTGGAADQTCGAVDCSADGEFAVFVTAASLASVGTNGCEQIYRYSSRRDQCELVSVYGGKAADKKCETPAISSNGRFVTFTSAATNLRTTAAVRPQLYRYEGGLEIYADDISVLAGEQKTISVSVCHMGDSARFKLLSEPKLCKLETTTGVQLTVGRTVDFSQLLPLILTTSAATGSETVRFAVSEDNGKSWHESSFLLTVSTALYEYASLTETNAVPPAGRGTYANVYYSVTISDSGMSAAFATGSELSALDTDVKFNVYQRDFIRQETKFMSLGNSQSVSMSGDGRTVAYIDLSTGQILGLKSSDWPDIDSIPARHAPAINRDGTVMAYVIKDSTKRLVMYEKGKKVSVVANNALGGTAATNAVCLNDDGSVLAYTADDGIRVIHFDAEQPQSRLVVSGECSFVSLSLSGRYVYYVQNGHSYRISTASGAQPQQLLQDTVSGAVVSRDGRYLYYIIDSMLYRKNLMSQEAGVPVVFCKGTGFQSLRASADGASALFVTDEALREDDENGVGDLVKVTLPVADGRKTVVAENAVEENAEQPPTARRISLSCGDIADAVLTLPKGTVSAKGYPVVLHSPDGTSEWYTLLYCPQMYFCGEDSVKLLCRDGLEEYEVTVALSVSNVNNPPEWSISSYKVELSEGESIDFKKLLGDRAAVANDHDLDYPEVTGEVLSYSLDDNAPEWAILAEDGNLVLDLTGRYDVASRNNEPVISFNVVVTDKAGVSAKLPVIVTVRNVSRSPVLGVTSLAFGEGQRIPWDAFDVSDPDEDDTDDTLKICFASSQYGSFVDADGKRISDPSAGVLKESFPVRYVATYDGVNVTLKIPCWAKDAGDLTSGQCPMKMTLKKQSMYLAAYVYGGKDSSGQTVMGRMTKGWNLLAAPYDFKDTAEFFKVLNIEVAWKWNAEKRCFELADSLKTDEGFFAYVTSVPTVDAKTMLTGNYTVPEMTGMTGWYLGGKATAELQKDVPVLKFDSDRSLFVRPESTLLGTGYCFPVR